MSSTSSSPTTSLPQVQLKRVEGFDPEKFRFKSAETRDFSQRITEPCEVWVDDRLFLVYEDLGSVPGLFKALERLKFIHNIRTAGLKNSNAATFGYLPRVAVRQNYCRPSTMLRDRPEVFAELSNWSRQISERFRLANPSKFEEQKKLVEGVLPDWRLPGGVFTTGVVNKNNRLGYHFDSGNFDGSWSCMMTLSQDIRGGDLVFPELKVGLSTEKNRLFMFCGGQNLHGVSPMREMNKGARRFSVVFYAMKTMCNCLPREEELLRARKDSTERFKRSKEERREEILKGRKR